MIYAEILLPLEGLGVDFDIQPTIGPVVHNPIRTLTDVQRLRPLDPAESVT